MKSENASHSYRIVFPDVDNFSEIMGEFVIFVEDRL